MFSSLQVRNVQEAYVRGLQLIRQEGVLQDTRNGTALVIPWPVVTVYECPLERVLLDPARDANPFFHLLESMWMMAGRDDVASLDPFNGGLKQYSDNGYSYHGAYGARWRSHFDLGDHSCQDGESDTPIDQLARIIELLRANPADRRIVMQMWDARTDLGQDGKDFPCNTQLYFRVHDGALQMTICNRSNDAIWGAYGANAVHMSVLLELVAAACGLRVGAMYQLSNNLHAYSETLEKAGEPRLYTARDMPVYSLAHTTAAVGLTMYDSRDFQPQVLFCSRPRLPVDVILAEIDEFWGNLGQDSLPDPQFFHPRGLETLKKVRASYLWNKEKEHDIALVTAREIPGSDWRRACVEWLERRAATRASKGAGQD